MDHAQCGSRVELEFHMQSVSALHCRMNPNPHPNPTHSFVPAYDWFPRCRCCNPNAQYPTRFPLMSFRLLFSPTPLLRNHMVYSTLFLLFADYSASSRFSSRATRCLSIFFTPTSLMVRKGPVDDVDDENKKRKEGKEIVVRRSILGHW